LKACLEFGLRPRISREAKKYIKGKVSLDDYMEALTHAQQEGNRFIIVASTNSVAATVWSYVCNSFQENEYRQVIFDKERYIAIIFSSQRYTYNEVVELKKF
jgi:hypothetical protein